MLPCTHLRALLPALLACTYHSPPLTPARQDRGRPARPRQMGTTPLHALLLRPPLASLSSERVHAGIWARASLYNARVYEGDMDHMGTGQAPALRAPP